MTDVTTATPDQTKRRNGAARDPVMVSSYALATHLGMTRQNVARLTAEGIIARSGDGYDLDHCRLRYIAHLRSEHRRSPRSEADADLHKQKARLMALRIAKQEKTVMLTSDHEATIDELVGLTLTKLGGWPARAAGADLGVRRKAEAVLRELRTEIANECLRLATERGEPDEQ